MEFRKGEILVQESIFIPYYKQNQIEGIHSYLKELEK
jgi:hypothetical protein